MKGLKKFFLLSMVLHLLALGIFSRGLTARPQPKTVEVRLTRLEVKSPAQPFPVSQKKPPVPKKNPSLKKPPPRPQKRKTSLKKSPPRKKKTPRTGVKKTISTKASKAKYSQAKNRKKIDKKAIEERLLEERLDELALKRRLAALEKKVSQEEASGEGVPIPEDLLARLKTHLESFWEIPASLSGRKDLSALAEVRLSATGEMLGYRLIRSSGNPLFDRAVEAALKAANPYPPPGRPLKIRVLFRPEGLS